MSFRLVYDAADLHRAAEMLTQAVDVARRIDQDAGRLAGGVADCGHDGLAGATQHFLDRWGYGMGVIAEQADAVAQAVREAVTAYEAVDSIGAAALLAPDACRP